MAAPALLGQGAHSPATTVPFVPCSPARAALYRSVERQQIGLEGDAFNQPDDFIDLAEDCCISRMGTQPLHGPPPLAATWLPRLLDTPRRPFAARRWPAAPSTAVAQAAGLRFGACRQVVAALCDFRSRLREVAHLGAHIAHHGPQVDLRWLQAPHQALQGLGSLCSRSK